MDPHFERNLKISEESIGSQGDCGSSSPSPGVDFRAGADLAPIRGSTWLDTSWVHICRRLSAIQPSSTKRLQSNRHGHSLAARDGLNINMRSLSRLADVGSYLHIWRRRHECLKNIFGAKILCHVSIHMSLPR